MHTIVEDTNMWQPTQGLEMTNLPSLFMLPDYVLHCCDGGYWLWGDLKKKTHLQKTIMLRGF